MRFFILQHINSLICLAIGLTAIVLWRRKRDKTSTNADDFASLGPTPAILVIAFGLAQFLFLENRGAGFASDSWRRVSTPDEVVSADFPASTTTGESSRTSRGSTVRTVAIQCNTSGRDINFELSCEAIPAATASMLPIDRFNEIRTISSDLGITIDSWKPEGDGKVPRYRMTTSFQQFKSSIRIVITPEAIYRLTVTSADGFHDDPAIARFVESFQVSLIPAPGRRLTSS